MAAPKLPPPFIHLANVANLRDIGGLCISTSDAIVKRSIVYRSADPSLCTGDEIEYIHSQLGIKYIFDLRSEPEFERQGVEVVRDFEARIAAYNQSGGGGGGGSVKIERVWLPVFKTEDYSPESIALRFRDYGAEDEEGFVRAYAEILKHGAPNYAKILRTLGGEERGRSGGVLLHCTAGKDRTGVIIAVILSLLGVSREDICREYQLTETGLAHRRSDFVERIMSSGAFEGEDGKAFAARMVGARAESMRLTLDMIDTEYGGVENYVRQVCGLSDPEVEAIRKNLVTTTARNATGTNVAVL